jgi:hypothetical protein
MLLNKSFSNSTMSSERAPQFPTTCTGGCGFFGNPAMQNYCSICFKKFVPNAENLLKQNQQNKKENELNIETINNPINNEKKTCDKDHKENNENPNSKNEPSSNNDDNVKQQKKKIRCHECSKKLSLVQQFECKCGQMFCTAHRFSDCHNCTFDYQKIHQQKLESLNPIVSPSKIPQI